jgi:tetratricopeptide (TPR) repeat protein
MLDSTLAEAYTTLAYVKFQYDWDWAGAERDFRKALELNPAYATAHQWYGQYLVAMGHSDEAFAELKRAQELDPVSLIIQANIGRVYLLRAGTIRRLNNRLWLLPWTPIRQPTPCWSGVHGEVYVFEDRRVPDIAQADYRASS